MPSPLNASSYGNPILIRRAFGNKAPSNRVYARIKCDLEATVENKSRRRLANGRLLNIGIGGAYLRAEGKLKKGDACRLQIADRDKIVTLEAFIARLHGQDKKSLRHYFYGLRFNLNADQAQRLRLSLDRLRQAAAPSSPPDAKLKWYWWY